MTRQPMTPHLTDELLSAHLDGETDVAETRAVDEHLPGCPDCRARAAQLAHAAAATGTAVAPPSDAAQDAAVLAALDTASPNAVGRWRRLAVIGAAAAVLAVAVAVPLLARASGTHTTAATARAPRTEKSAAASGAATPAEADLGDQTNVDAVASLVAGALAHPPGAQALAGPVSGTDSGATAAGGGGSATGSAVGSGGAPQAAASPGQTETQASVCPVPAGDALLYSAHLRWRGTDAEVQAVSSPGGRRLSIRARAGCRVLVDRSF